MLISSEVLQVAASPMGLVITASEIDRIDKRRYNRYRWDARNKVVLERIQKKDACCEEA